MYCLEHEDDWVREHDLERHDRETFGGVDCLDGVCMLPEGHDGPHEWTPDDQIFVEPADSASVKQTEKE